MNAVKLIAAPVSIAISFALVACGGSQGGPVEATSAGPASAVQQWNADDPELTVDEVEAMLAALEKQTGASRSEIQAGSLLYSPSGVFSADAEDPKKPTEYNEYAINIYTNTSDVTPYDYGGAESYPDLQATLFPVAQFTPEMIVNTFKDSFTRVTGNPADLRVDAVTVTRNLDGALEMMVANGTERDQQAVYYDANGQFLRVS